MNKQDRQHENFPSHHRGMAEHCGPMKSNKAATQASEKDPHEGMEEMDPNEMEPDADSDD